MFESLRIRNYRVFKDLEIGGLHRINLIGGKNNSGKSSLLEAILLLSEGGEPRLGLNESVIRGSVPDAVRTPQTIEALWRALFHGLNTACPIVIACESKRVGSLKLNISAETWQGSSPTLVSLSGSDMPSVSNVFDGNALTFRFCDSHNGVALGQLRFINDRVEPLFPGTRGPFDARMIESRSGSLQDDAVVLGKLRTHKRGDMLLKALQFIEPRLQSIEDNSASGIPMIWGDIGLSELVPFPAMGEGMTRLARIILAISSTPGGVVLVDEIENGIHHSVQVDVWKAIAAAAEQFDTQVFATTHSFECIETAFEGLGSEGFRLFRISNRKGVNRAIRYEPNEIQVAIRRGLEVR